MIPPAWYLVGGTALGFLVVFAAWWAERRARAKQARDRDRQLEAIPSRTPGTIAEYMAIVDDHRPSWIPAVAFLEGVLHTGGEGPTLPAMAWKAIEAAKPLATETAHVVRALLEAERSRERAAAQGAACTRCPLHCGAKR